MFELILGVSRIIWHIPECFAILELWHGSNISPNMKYLEFTCVLAPNTAEQIDASIKEELRKIAQNAKLSR